MAAADTPIKTWCCGTIRATQRKRLSQPATLAFRVNRGRPDIGSTLSLQHAPEMDRCLGAELAGILDGKPILLGGTEPSTLSSSKPAS